MAEGRPPNTPIKLVTKIKVPYFVHHLVHHKFFFRLYNDHRLQLTLSCYESAFLEPKVFD